MLCSHIFSGQEYSFYINFDTPISDPDFANFRLDLRRADAGSVPFLTDIGTLTQDFIDAPFNVFYNILCLFTFPTGVPFGMYQFAIYNTSTAATMAVSSMIQVEEPEMVRNTARVTFRHSINRNNINYEGNPDFYQSFTLPLIQTDFTIDQERKQYRNVSDRRLRNYKSYKDEIAKIESYYFDEEGHKAMSDVYDHDEIFLDLNHVTPKDVYAIEDRPTYQLSKGSINVIVDETIPHPHPAWVVPVEDGEYSDEYSGDFD
jgi:hypothetical protein